MSEEIKTDDVQPIIKQVEEVKADENIVEEEKTIEGTKIEKVDSVAKRINRAVARQHAAEEREAKALEEVVILKLEVQAAKEGKPKPSQEEILEGVEIYLFNKKCDAVHEQGISKFEDFEKKLKDLGKINMLTPKFLQVITELDKADEILYYLANDIDKAKELKSLNEVQQALALAKLDTTVAKKPAKEASKAPKPIEPVDGKNTKNSNGWASKWYEGMSMKEFVDWDNNPNALDKKRA